MSMTTGFLESVWRVRGVMNCEPAAVRIVVTLAPSLLSSRMISHAL